MNNGDRLPSVFVGKGDTLPVKGREGVHSPLPYLSSSFVLILHTRPSDASQQKPAVLFAPGHLDEFVPLLTVSFPPLRDLTCCRRARRSCL